MSILRLAYKNIGFDFLSEIEIKKIETLLKRSRHIPPTLEDVWSFMDYVWDEIGCNNIRPDSQKLTEFYNHPVWLINGFFIEEHKISLQHRSIVSTWIKDHSPEIKRMLDFGGGFGTLARMVGDNCPSIAIDILEPSPSDYAKSKSKKLLNIKFINTLEHTKESLYDCIVAFDVMEHLIDSLGTLKKLIKLTNVGGYLIFANNFYPVIKCHLPSNFHFRYSFSFFTHILGLKHVAKCSNTHANIYQKIRTVRCNDVLLKKIEVVSRTFFPFLVSLSTIRRSLVYNFND